MEASEDFDPGELLSHESDENNDDENNDNDNDENNNDQAPGDAPGAPPSLASEYTSLPTSPVAFPETDRGIGAPPASLAGSSEPTEYSTEEATATESVSESLFAFAKPR